MKLLVSGGRSFNDEEFVVRQLVRIHKSVPITTVVHGCARGVDTYAGDWAKSVGIPQEKFPIESWMWKTYGKKAGPKRNREMFDTAKPTVVLCFPGGSGTGDMYDYATSQGAIVERILAQYFKRQDPVIGFLSNFALGYGFEDNDGIWWDTSEHYYQAMKSPFAEEREEVRKQESPGAAKKKGREINCYADWGEGRKIEAMMMALGYKFSDPEAKTRLINTSPDYLVEYAPWGDDYWGVDKHYKGKNILGKLLVALREELIEKSRH
jgi:ribA/ribD-fused uncharacterized protein